MAAHQVLPLSTSDTERPPGITCDDYVRGEGKRCRHYASGGGCALSGRGVCTEWLKHNRPAQAPQLDDRFEHATSSVEVPPAPTAHVPTVDVDTLRGFTTEDIDSFKTLGVEVLMHSTAYGEIWLVPAYTGKARNEITPEHAATLARVLSVFPGSHVVTFEKKTPHVERQERPETRS